MAVFVWQMFEYRTESPKWGPWVRLSLIQHNQFEWQASSILLVERISLFCVRMMELIQLYRHRRHHQHFHQHGFQPNHCWPLWCELVLVLEHFHDCCLLHLLVIHRLHLLVFFFKWFHNSKMKGEKEKKIKLVSCMQIELNLISS